MQFIVVVSNTHTVCDIMHAVGHMAVGIGSRLPEGYCPEILIYQAPAASIHEFRDAAYLLYAASPQTIGYSDFVAAPMDNPEEDYARRIELQTPSAMDFSATGIIGENTALYSIRQILKDKNYRQLKISGLYNRPSKVTIPILPSIEDTPILSAEAITRGLLIALSPNLGSPDALFLTIRTALILGRDTENTLLGLRQYTDRAGQLHPNLSQYPLGILCASGNNQLPTLQNKIQNLIITGAIESICVLTDAHDEPAVVAMCGQMDQIAPKVQNFNPWVLGFSSEAFMPKRPPSPVLTLKFESSLDKTNPSGSGGSSKSQEDARKDVKGTADDLSKLKL